MANISSAQTGNWSSTSTWTGGVVPANGDTASIAHAITVDVDTIVGTSPAAGTAAITQSSAGSLTIAAGKTLRIRGDYTVACSTTLTDKVTLSAGASLIFDASLASSPTSQKYKLQLGTAHNERPRLKVNGTSGSRCSIRSDSGGGNGTITGPGFIASGSITATYCDFTRIGDVSLKAIEVYGSNGTGIILTDCTFDTCGSIGFTTNIGAGFDLSLVRVRWTNTVSLCVQIGNTSFLTTGTRLVSGCTFDQVVNFYTPTDFTITGNYFGGRFQVTNGAWATFTGNFVRLTDQANLAASASGNYYIYDSPAQGNPHLIGILNYARDMSLTDSIFEFNGTDATGDCILLYGATSSPCTATIRRNIFLPNAAGNCSGTPFSALGNANTSIVFEHNTYIAGSQGAAVGETYAGFAGMLASFKSNLTWDTSLRGTILYDSGTNDNVPDLVSAANCDYNGRFNVYTYHTSLEFSTGTPGVHDVTVNPNFVDSTRNLSKWDLSLGGAGTVSAALTRLQSDPSLISSLINYVRAGFAPTNPAFKGVAHDAGDIGAVEVVIVGRPDHAY